MRFFDPVDPERIQRIRAEKEKEFANPISAEEVAQVMPGVTYRRHGMIYLTKLNQVKFALNADLIETIEETPDTVISLVTGRKYIVMEPMEEVRNKCIEYKREIYRN